MDSRLTWEAVETLVAERHRAAEENSRLRRRSQADEDDQPAGSGRGDEVTVRFAVPADAGALERLAELDSARRLTGPALVATVEGEVLAALPVGEGSAIADPFRPTANLVRLLELRRAQLLRRDRTHHRAHGGRRPARAG